MKILLQPVLPFTKGFKGAVVVRGCSPIDKHPTSGNQRTKRSELMKYNYVTMQTNKRKEIKEITN